MEPAVPTRGDKAAGVLLAGLALVMIVWLALKSQTNIAMAAIHMALAMAAVAGAVAMMQGRKWGYIVVAVWGFADSAATLTGQQMGRSLVELDLMLGLLNLFVFYTLLRLFGILGPKP